MAAALITRKVIVLCDGTWCGRETDTRSNIDYLARMIGIDTRATPAEYISPYGDVRAKYFDGVGLGGDFASYLWNGALATQAKDECTRVYDFIVQNFVWDDVVQTEVWMFGISRGAYIVRSVAGLINNCGILRDKTNQRLIHMAYDLYRSPYAVNKPSSPEMLQFRANASYAVRTPIKFMGLFDTVGSRGVPKLNYNTGTGFEWPEFHDNIVSTAVEKVYHAVAIHDRLWAFQPCLASRDARHANNPALADLMISQKWFPGCHYDLARQEFQFLREGGNLLERALFPILNMISSTVSPNDKLADLVLIWMLRGIRTEGGGDIIQYDLDGGRRNVTGAINDTRRQLVMRSPTGTGDIYGDILSTFPGGKLFWGPIRWFKDLNKTAYAVLFNPVDRVIPDHGRSNGSAGPIWNQVYDYTVPDADLNGAVVGDIAEIGGRYPSETCENFVSYMDAVGRSPWD